MNTSKILILDDDKIVTTALKTLLKIEGFSGVVFFNSPNEALEYLKGEKPDLIISDFMMPEMNGFEFLSKAKELYSEVSMILLTGYADKENAIRAINEIGLYKYIEKPWDNDDLILNIRNGIERSSLLAQLKEKIDELEKANVQLEKYSRSLEEMVAERTSDLIQANSKLSGIITYCADGIVIINSDGKILQANPSAENMIGLGEMTLQEMMFANICVSEKQRDFKQKLQSGEEFLLKDYYILNNLCNKKIPVEVNFAPIIDENDTNTKFVGVIRNIQTQKEMERLRDDFIATLTHDLRTPLLASIQTLKFFLDGTLGKLEEKQEMLLSTMKKSNEDLLGLVNALLEVYRYEAGRLTLCKTKFNFKELVEQCYMELKPLADKKEIAFKTEDISDFDILADRGELRRVIINLCGNAINYTPKQGEVKIQVKTEEKDLIFSVIDNGGGIPKEDIPYLFKRFSQGTSKKRSAGTGLGLYLSRQIVEAHSGKIWLESKLQKGSEFSFLLTDVIVSVNNEKLEKFSV